MSRTADRAGARAAFAADPAAAFDAVVAAPFGALGLRVTDRAITHLALLPGMAALVAPTSPLGSEVAAALAAYFADSRAHLALPVAPQGTPFQRRVWQALRQIPCGETRTYGELAAALGSSARAVGGACRANPIALVIPCHRVVAAGGLGGFSGETGGKWLAVKRWLLAHEGVLGRGA